MRVTLCLGGSILVPSGPDVDMYVKTISVVKRLSEKHEVLIVTGGGRVAREYIEAAKKMGLGEVECHQIGIAVTRLNAMLLSLALGGRERMPAESLERALIASAGGDIPVMGGTTPGQTTDAVAAMLAHLSRSDLLIFFSDVDGVYTEDPKVNPSAKKLDKITASKLVELAGTSVSPGMRTIIDPVAARLVLRHRIKTLFLGKHELERLPEILEGAPHTGTEVVFE